MTFPHVPFVTNTQLAAAFPNVADPLLAIQYAIESCDGVFDGMGFLEAWNEGDLIGIRTYWPLYYEHLAKAAQK